MYFYCEIRVFTTVLILVSPSIQKINHLEIRIIAGSRNHRPSVKILTGIIRIKRHREELAPIRSVEKQVAGWPGVAVEETLCERNN